jgi:hypothetical protein
VPTETQINPVYPSASMRAAGKYARKCMLKEATFLIGKSRFKSSGLFLSAWQ